jgi:hypothetical protein
MQAVDNAIKLLLRRKANGSVNKRQKERACEVARWF